MLGNEKFNQNKYIQQYNKDHYKTFKVDLKKEELEELNRILEKLGITKAQFLRDAIREVQFRYNLNKKDKQTKTQSIEK